METTETTQATVDPKALELAKELTAMERLVPGMLERFDELRHQAAVEVLEEAPELPQADEIIKPPAGAVEDESENRASVAEPTTDVDRLAEDLAQLEVAHPYIVANRRTAASPERWSLGRVCSATSTVGGSTIFTPS